MTNINHGHYHNFSLGFKANYNNPENLTSLKEKGNELLGDNFDNRTEKDDHYYQFETLIENISSRIVELLEIYSDLGCQ